MKISLIESNPKCFQVMQQDEGGVMKCLIEFKTGVHGDYLDPKCSSAIEHWQIFTLTDWHFSAAFKKSCKKDVKQLCEEYV